MKSTVSTIMLILILASTLAFGVNAEKVTLPHQLDTPVTIPEMKKKYFTMSFPMPKVVKVGRYDWLRMENCTYLTKPGQPMLPVRSIVVKLPEGSAVSTVRVEVEETSLPGNFLVCPVPSPDVVGSQKSGRIFEDPTIYNIGAPFPKQSYIYREAHGMDVRTNKRVKYIALNLFPLRYLPTENKVLRAEEIAVTLTYTEPQKTLTAQTDLKNIIITSPTLESYALELAEWKNNTGVISRVVNTTWIYDHYSGVDNQEKIRNCIKDFVATYGIIYVTIFGDVDQVPVRYVYVPDGHDTYTPTDLYYADLDGTWDDNGDGLYADQRYDDVDGIPDVYVGRIPPSLTEYAQVAVDKIKGYQAQFEPSQNWTRRIVLAAGTCSGDGFTNLDKNGTTVLKEYIADIVIDKDIVKLYESTGNLSRALMASEINKGALFVNFAGHGDSGSGLLAVGWLFYWDIPGIWWNGFGISDVQPLTNGFKLPVVTTMSCSTARFDDTDCIGEWFVLEPDGGSIAYFGATRVAWGYFDELAPYGLMGEMDRRIYESFYEGSTRLGQMWGETVGGYVQSNIWDYQSASVYDVKTFMEFVLLGDPSLRIYNPDYPETLHVSEDYPTIQTAINAAYDGDTVFVSSGTYYEHVVVNKSVSLIGENKYITIIDGNKTDEHLITVSADQAQISNFTVRNAGDLASLGLITEGVRLLYVDDVVVSECFLSDNDCGIMVWGGVNNSIKDNNFVDNKCGLSLHSTLNNSIIRNNVSQNLDYGISIWTSGGNIFKNNSISDSGSNLYFFASSTLQDYINDIDTSNTINGKPIYFLINQKDLTINTSLFPEIGYLGLVNSTNILVENLNLLTSNGQGILFAYTNNSVIKGVTLADSRHGILLVGSRNNMITSSLLQSNVVGIKLSSSDGNTITGNTLSYNWHGVYASLGTNNLFENNTITGSFSCALLSYHSSNILYHNSFIHNSKQVNLQNSTDIWDNGAEGNHWSDYNGTDTDGDGVGDTHLPWQGVDYYPLMNPYKGHNIAIVKIDVMNKTVVGQGYIQEIDVEVANIGSFPQTFSLTVYANDTETQTFAVSIAAENSTTLTFYWDTSVTHYGNYTITAYAWPVPNEVDESDNLFVLDMEVCITIPGDVDGDRDVDIYDVVKITGIYGSKRGDPQFNPNSDLDDDGEIKIYDVVRCTSHYGQSWQP